MKKVERIEGRMLPLDRADVDTDQIMPKQFLKRIERTGFGEFVFHEWRQDPDFVLNDPRYDGASILLSGPNFGSGSSREHAPWGLQQYGFEAIVAASFADIFKQNCARIGLLTVELNPKTVQALIEFAESNPGASAEIDVAAETLTTDLGVESFSIDPATKFALVNGLDAIGRTLQLDDRIDAFERTRASWLPSTLRAVGRT